MEFSSSLGLSFLPPLPPTHLKPSNVFLSPFTTSSQSLKPAKKSIPITPIPSKTHQTPSLSTISPTPFLISHKYQIFILKTTFFSGVSIAPFLVQLPSIAAETFAPSSNRIDLESVLVSIDDFFNRNPFFVSGVTFIWLVVIPLVEGYFKKFKFLSAIDAFRKLRDDSSAQLLDVRDRKSLGYLGSPNLKILDKKTVQVEFKEGEEDGFLKEVLGVFKDPANTVICVLDNFDGNSMKVAELLFQNGFKEAYAIRGGLRGKKGWQAIQETLLPPSVHVFPRNSAASKQSKMKEGTNLQNDNNGQTPSAPANINGRIGNGYIHTKGVSSQATVGSSGFSSPYPNYPDMKPPSSPTPSKPQK